MRHRRATAVPIVAATLLLAGCAGSGSPKPASTAARPTATLVGAGTPPVAGTTATRGASAAAATRTHDRAGESCSGRDQARYAGERLICITGRLKPRR